MFIDYYDGSVTPKVSYNTPYPPCQCNTKPQCGSKRQTKFNPLTDRKDASWHYQREKVQSY